MPAYTKHKTTCHIFSDRCHLPVQVRQGDDFPSLPLSDIYESNMPIYPKRKKAGAGAPPSAAPAPAMFRIAFIRKYLGIT